MVSSTGKIWIFVRFGTSGAALMETTSPNLTRKFLRTTLFILIFPSSILLSTKAIHKVSFLFLPLIRTGSPLKIFNSYNFAADKQIAELSSLTASSTINLFGAFFLSKIAVEKSFYSLF